MSTPAQGCAARGRRDGLETTVYGQAVRAKPGSYLPSKCTRRPRPNPGKMWRVGWKANLACLFCGVPNALGRWAPKGCPAAIITSGLIRSGVRAGKLVASPL